MTRSAALLLALVTLTACGGGSVDDDIADLRAKLSASDYEAVIAAAPAVIARCASEGADATKAWQVQKIRLEATAKSGDGAGTEALFAELAVEYGDRLTAPLFAQMGGFVSSGGDLEGAIVVLEAGRAKYPDMGDKFDPVIEDIKVKALASGDEGALEALKSLGYL